MRLVRFFLSLLMIVLLVEVSQAKPKKLTKAEEQFNAFVIQATNDFKTQEFKKALDGYKSAYNLDPVPALLLAIGQCHRSLNDYAAAITSYKQYLSASPNAADTKAVEDTIKELERLVAQGTLDFSTDPADAQLYIDGELKGVTPISITGIDPGPHKIKITKDGYLPFEKTFNFSPGQRQSIGTLLEPMPGFLEVTSEQDPVTILVNGAFVGASPMKMQTMAGEYLVQFRKDKFQDKEEKVTVIPGQTVSLSPILEPGKGKVKIKINLKDADVSIGKTHKAKTDENGQWLFENVPAGRQQVRISLPPFQESTQTITLDAQETEVIETFIKDPPLPRLLYGVSGVSLLGAGVLGGVAYVTFQETGTPVGAISALALAGTFLVSGTGATFLFVKQRVNKIAESRDMKKEMKQKDEELKGEEPK